TPVKRYSSGMTVRLGFAVAAHLEPEILIVDEVLAVGDAEFQKKAIGKMQDISRGGGRTVIFVSHNMSSIRNLCDKVLVVDNGIITFLGKTDDGIDHYTSIDKEGFSNQSLKNYSNLLYNLKIQSFSNGKELGGRSRVLLGQKIEFHLSFTLV